jgi:hypothetical protein
MIAAVKTIDQGNRGVEGTAFIGGPFDASRALQRSI